MPDPQDPSPPLWRRLAELVGVDDDIDAATGAASTAGHWIASQLPQASPDHQSRLAAQEQLLRAHTADLQRQGEARWAPVTDAVQRFFGSEPVERFGQHLHDEYAPAWTPTPETAALADQARKGITARSDALRAALPKAPVTLQGHGAARGLSTTVDPMKPFDWMVAAQHDVLPNFALDQAVDATTPVGGLSNLDVPLPVLAQAGSAVGHLAGVIPPGLTEEIAEAARRIRAYHGSPHSFDKFDISKIGTGEGAASYGHGLYFAGNEDVARSYRDKLARGILVNQQPPTGAVKNALEFLDADILRNGGPQMALRDAIERMERQSAFYRQTYRGPGDTSTNLYDTAAERLRGIDPATLSAPGHMYEVGLNVDPEHLLDWDAPLSAQPAAVHRVLQGLPAAQEQLEALGRRQPRGYPEPLRGEHAYGAIAEATAPKDEWIADHETGLSGSRALLEQGVPGIRYLDQGSRGRGVGTVHQLGDNWFVPGSSTPYTTRGAAQAALDASGNATHNYTMFDDESIDILRKYGLLAPLAAGGAAAGLAASQSGDDSGQGGGIGAGIASVAPIMLGGHRPVFNLDRTLKYLGDSRYALKPAIVERLANLYEKGRELTPKATWGGTDHPELLAAFGGDSELARQWARFFGTTSAGTSVPKNTQESIAALTHALDRPGVPFEATGYAADKTGRMRPRLSLYDTVITNAESKLGSLNQNLAGFDPTGPKTEAMGQFMYGQPRSPIDRHVLWGLGSADDTLSEQHTALKNFMQKRERMAGTGRDQLNQQKVYTRYEQAIADALQGLDPTRPYNPLFGDFWEGARAVKGEKYQGGPIDILRSRGLLGPDFLTDPDRLKHTLSDTSGLWVAQPPTPRSFLDLGGR